MDMPICDDSYILGSGALRFQFQKDTFGFGALFVTMVAIL